MTVQEFIAVKQGLRKRMLNLTCALPAPLAQHLLHPASLTHALPSQQYSLADTQATADVKALDRPQYYLNFLRDCIRHGFREGVIEQLHFAQRAHDLLFQNIPTPVMAPSQPQLYEQSRVHLMRYLFLNSRYRDALHHMPHLPYDLGDLAKHPRVLMQHYPLWQQAFHHPYGDNLLDLGTAYLTVIQLHNVSGHPKRALEVCSTALQLFQSLNVSESEALWPLKLAGLQAYIRHSMGETHQAYKEQQEVLTTLDSTLQTWPSASGYLTYSYILSYWLDVLITCASTQDIQDAIAKYHTISMWSRHFHVHPLLLCSLSQACHHIGDDMRAHSLIDEALAFCQTLQAQEPKNPLNRYNLTEVYMQYATLVQHLPEKAEMLLQGALQNCTETKPKRRSDIYQKLADISAAKQNFGQAYRYHQHYMQAFNQYQHERTSTAYQASQALSEAQRVQHEIALQRLRTQELERLIKLRTQETEQAYLEVIERLAIANETRDDMTGQHTYRVGNLAAEIAKALGWPCKEIEWLRVAARLHDLGKIGIPDDILHKPSQLTADEFRLIRTHTLIGQNMLKNSSSPIVQMAEAIALNHHERWDGLGYPYGQARDEIPLSARIVSVADVFDVLINDRPYKKAWPLSSALQEIERCAGTQFDPEVVYVFLNLSPTQIQGLVA